MEKGLPKKSEQSVRIAEKYSYDDVLLVPGYSDVLPGETDVRTRLVGDLYLNTPVLTAAMDTITEYEMAINMALVGGAGVIHRNLAPLEQAKQVSQVKRYLNWVISDPLTVQKGQTVRDVREITRKHCISGLPVVEGDRFLCGIITSRDLRFCSNDEQKVDEIMTKDLVTVQEDPDEACIREKFNKNRIEKLPVVDRNNRLIGLITVKDMEKKEAYPQAALDSTGHLIVGAAVSPNDYRERLPLLVKSGCDFVVLDTAHGLSQAVLNAVEGIKKDFSIPVIAGNAVDALGTRQLIERGADAVKIGVGAGSICTTRIIAGVGVPQFSAVLESAEEAAKSGIPIIADGGIRFSGDITKALGAGASSVMLGNLLAGLKESPGKEVIHGGRIFKEYRGMGSLAAIKEGSADRYQIQQGESPVPEGIEGLVPFKGELKNFIYQLVSGLRKGMGYCGCRNLEELKNYKRFIKITKAGLIESHTHGVQITHEAPNYSPL